VQHNVEDLPDEALRFLLPSRYCEVDKLNDEAWRLFGPTRPGWSRVQTICDWVHNHITFGYHFADPQKSALEVYRDGKGVCRDFMHLAVTFCRCLNIPARYVTGYLGDIGVPPAPTRGILAHGSKFSSAGNGTLLMRVTTNDVSAVFSWPSVATPLTLH